MSKKNHPESEIQRACVRWFRLQYPEPQYLIYANANGGYRSRVEAAIMQGEGVRAGIPDLTIVSSKRVIWVELKSRTGRLTESQCEVMGMIDNIGHNTLVCRSIDEFIVNVNELLK